MPSPYLPSLVRVAALLAFSALGTCCGTLALAQSAPRAEPGWTLAAQTACKTTLRQGLAAFDQLNEVGKSGGAFDDKSLPKRNTTEVLLRPIRTGVDGDSLGQQQCDQAKIKLFGSLAELNAQFAHTPGRNAQDAPACYALQEQFASALRGYSEFAITLNPALASPHATAFASSAKAMAQTRKNKHGWVDELGMCKALGGDVNKLRKQLIG